MSQTIVVRGVLGDGVECPLIETDSGKGYTLLGSLGGFKTGDRVRIAGYLAEISFCMQGETIVIQHIEADARRAAAAGKTTGERVASIEALNVRVLWRLPIPTHEIFAAGYARSGGWSNPRLRPAFTRYGLRHGIYDFAFEADPPTGPSTDQMTPIAAAGAFGSETMTGAPVQSIVVHAEGNRLEWPGASSAERTRAGLRRGGDHPFPFSGEDPFPFNPSSAELGGEVPSTFRRQRSRAGDGDVFPHRKGSAASDTATGSSGVSFEEAFREALRQLPPLNVADALVSIGVDRMYYVYGSIVGLRPTYNVDVTRSFS